MTRKSLNKATKQSISLHYHCNKLGCPEISLRASNGPGRYYEIEGRLEQNLGNGKFVEVFGKKTTLKDDGSFEPNRVYQGTNITAKSIRKNGIDCLYTDESTGRLIQTREENNSSRYGYTEFSIRPYKK